MNDIYEIIIEERISFYLMILKITPNLKGYEFFKDCTRQILLSGDKSLTTTRELYQEVADKFDETPPTVERALRHAIGVSEKRKGIKDLEKNFSMQIGEIRPSPKELLGVLVEQLILETGIMFEENDGYISLWKETLIN